jgi:hypothetical protein
MAQVKWLRRSPRAIRGQSTGCGIFWKSARAQESALVTDQSFGATRLLVALNSWSMAAEL